MVKAMRLTRGSSAFGKRHTGTLSLKGRRSRSSGHGHGCDRQLYDTPSNEKG